MLVAIFAACSLTCALAGCADRSSPAAVTTGNPPVVAAKQAEAPKPEEKSKADDPPAKPQTEVSKADVSKQPTRDITFDTIKFDMQKDDPFARKMLTPAIEKLTNSKVRIRGYILPSFQQSGLTQFVLVRDNMQCCFGPGAALFDCIVVKMNEGKSTDFTTRPVAVEGVFSIEELHGPDEKCLAIYHLDASQVQ